MMSNLEKRDEEDEGLGSSGAQVSPAERGLEFSTHLIIHEKEKHEFPKHGFP